jgi:purine-binding chemotaxis protein CheW
LGDRVKPGLLAFNIRDTNKGNIKMTTGTNTAQGEEQLVVFDLAAEAYGVDIGAVREIIRMQDITKVPGAPEIVEGIINLRGNVIPVVDLRKRFRLEVTKRDKDNRIVVVDIGGQDIGVVVDAVNEVLRIASDSVEPPSSVITTAESVYLLGIVKLEGRLVILLDLEKVLTDSEKASLTGSADETAHVEAAD